MAKVTLDAETFKALASPTRLQVMRALAERRKTLTELARDLELNKATVHEHLTLLTAAGLAKKRDDEGRKWIYYELTWRGERILHPQETTTFSVLLGLGVAAAGGGVAMLVRALSLWADQDAGPAVESAPFEIQSDENRTSSPEAAGTAGGARGDPGAEDAAPAPEPPMDDPAPSDGSWFLDFDGWTGVVLLVVSLVFFALAGWMFKRLRPGAPE